MTKALNEYSSPQYRSPMPQGEFGTACRKRCGHPHRCSWYGVG